MSNQTFIDADTPQIHNICPCYSYTSRYHFDMADNFKTMN